MRGHKFEASTSAVTEWSTCEMETFAQRYCQLNPDIFTIFGGDLNTWSEGRQSTLDAFAKEHNLTAVVFSPDHRTTRFGRALDHLYVRGLSWQSAAATPVTTSDHNPLIAELEYAGP